MKPSVLGIAAGLVLATAGCASPVSPTTSPSPSPVPSAAAPTVAPTEAPAASPTAAIDLASSLNDLFRTSFMATGFNGAALVAKDGTLVYATGIGMADEATQVANTPETRFRIGSLTKQFTAMGILILESRGRIAQTDSICEYLETCPSGWEVITIAHLLGHTSGLADFTEQPDFDPMQAASPAQTVASVSDIPLTGTPGEAFRYSNTGYVVLGMVIEQASGMSYEAFLQDEIFEPLGMDDSGYEHGATPGLATGYADGVTPADPLDMSVPYAAGGLYSTVFDLGRWHEGLAANTLAPASDMARYVTPLIDVTDRAGFGYAYGQYVGDDGGSPLEWHDGGINGFISQLSRYPDDHITVAILTNREQSPNLLSLAQAAATEARKSP